MRPWRSLLIAFAAGTSLLVFKKPAPPTTNLKSLKSK